MSKTIQVTVPDSVGLSSAADMADFDVDSPFSFQLLGAVAADRITVWMTANASATALSSANALLVTKVAGQAVVGVTATAGLSILGAPRPRYLYVERTKAGSTGASLAITGRETPGTSSSPFVVPVPTLQVGDTAVNGPLGGLTAAQSVDLYSAFTLTQTTASVAITLPAPTVPTATRVVTVEYLAPSTAACSFYSVEFAPGTSTSVQMIWNGTSWTRVQPSATFGGNATSAAASIGTTTDYAFRFLTNALTRVTITGGNTATGGYVGIGTPAPVARLDVEEPVDGVDVIPAWIGGGASRSVTLVIANRNGTSFGTTLKLIGTSGDGWSLNGDPSFAGQVVLSIRDETHSVDRLVLNGQTGDAQIVATGGGAFKIDQNGNSWTWASAMPTNSVGQTLKATPAGVISAGPSIQKGTATLLATGISAAIAANVSATSVIKCDLRSPAGAGAATTTNYQALMADRVNGSPGSFKITALATSSGAAVANDTSTVEWTITDN